MGSGSTGTRQGTISCIACLFAVRALAYTHPRWGGQDHSSGTTPCLYPLPPPGRRQAVSCKGGSGVECRGRQEGFCLGRKKCSLAHQPRPLVASSLPRPPSPLSTHHPALTNAHHILHAHTQERCKATQRTLMRRLLCLPKPLSFLLALCNAALPSTTGGMQESTPKRRPKLKRNRQKRVKKGMSARVTYIRSCTTTPTGSLLSV